MQRPSVTKQNSFPDPSEKPDLVSTAIATPGGPTRGLPLAEILPWTGNFRRVCGRSFRSDRYVRMKLPSLRVPGYDAFRGRFGAVGRKAESPIMVARKGSSFGADGSRETRRDAEPPKSSGGGETSSAEWVRGADTVGRDDARARFRDYTALLAHEVQRHLASVLAGVGLLRRRLPSESSIAEICDELSGTVWYLSHLADDALALASSRDSRTRRIFLSDALRHVSDRLSAISSFSDVDLELSAPDAEVDCDVDLLRTVLIRLILDASEIKRPSSRIGIDASFKAEPQCCAFVLRFDATVPGAARPGFDRRQSTADRAERRFEIARQLAELNGGKLEVTSPSTGGTVVTLSMPAST